MALGMQVYESVFAVEQDGTEDKEIQVERGGFLARLFDPDPTLPLWQRTKTKIIQVPHYKPAMYKMMDKLIVHPALLTPLLEQIRKASTSKPSDVFRW